MAMLVLTSISYDNDMVSAESLRRKEIMVKLCIPIIDEYSRFRAGLAKSKNPVHLEREFNRCAEIIDEYETLK